MENNISITRYIPALTFSLSHTVALAAPTPIGDIGETDAVFNHTLSIHVYLKKRLLKRLAGCGTSAPGLSLGGRYTEGDDIGAS